MLSFLLIIRFPDTRDFLHVIGPLTPRVCILLLWDLQLRQQREKIFHSVGQNSIYLPEESVKGWDTSQKKKRLKTTALGQGSHVCILSLAKHTKVSMRARVCVCVKDGVHYTWTHSFSISMFVQIAHSFHINWEFQSKLLSRKVQCDLLLFHAHWKEAAGIFAF